MIIYNFVFMYISPVSSSSATAFHFLGTGYAAISRIPNYNSREFQITFQFKTFWANSTLLFAGNEAMVCILVIFILWGTLWVVAIIVTMCVCLFLMSSCSHFVNKLHRKLCTEIGNYLFNEIIFWRKGMLFFTLPLVRRYLFK